MDLSLNFVSTLLGVIVGGGITIFGQWIIDRRSREQRHSDYYYDQAQQIVELLRARSHCLAGALSTRGSESREFQRELNHDYSLAMLALRLNSAFPELVDRAEQYFELGIEALRVAGLVAAEAEPFADISEEQRRRLLEVLVIAERPILAGLAEILKQLSPTRPKKLKIDDVLEIADQQRVAVKPQRSA